jgi:hypothetical protein
MKTKHTLQTLAASILSLVLLSPIFAQSTIGDLLLYFDSDRELPGITAYNPANGEKIYLPVTSEVEGIKTSGDGRIAYIQDNDVWILDVINAPDDPISITQTPDEQEILIDWTPDSSLLQYKVGSSPGPLLYNYDGEETIPVGLGYHLEQVWHVDGWYVASDNDNTDEFSWYVWDGQQKLDLNFPVLPSEPMWQDFLWTPNNHLFITIGYRKQEYMQPIGPTQVFYWNGVAVHEIARPMSDETFILSEWSRDGRLTFYISSDTSINRWYIWDGISFTTEGIPDMSTLTPINSISENIGSIRWMPDGRLAIVAAGDAESGSLFGHPFSCIAPCATQVYLWDEQHLTQVTENDFLGLRIDIHDSGHIAVSITNGLVTSGVVVFDNDLEPVFRSGGPYSLSRWSDDGNLAFCRGDNLLVWDGQNIVELSSRTYSQWLIPRSFGMLCSTG